MTDTALALLSPDNVLRLVKKNGNGVEELAAVALGHEYTVPELLDFCSMLTAVTAKAPPKAKPAAKHPKAITAKAKEKKPAQRKRQPNHKWLSSAWLIRFVDSMPGQRASVIGKQVCETLGKEYTTANAGDGGVISSRLSNLVVQGKLTRGDDGLFFSTQTGLDWADKVEPETAETPG